MKSEEVGLVRATCVKLSFRIHKLYLYNSFRRSRLLTVCQRYPGLTEEETTLE